MKKIILLISLFIFLSNFTISQINLEWIKRIPNLLDAPSLCSDMVLDNSGNIYVSGSTGVSGEGLEFILTKYKSNGNSIWVRYFGGAFHHADGSVAMLKDKYDNIYLTGFVTTSSSSGLDIATLKYDSSGTLLWSNIYSGGSNTDDYPYSIAIDSNYNVFIAGFTYGGGRDAIVIKYNPTGVQQWFKTYRSFSSYTDEAYSICADNEGNSYASLLTTDTGNGNIGIIKYDPYGTTIWMKKYYGPGQSFDYPSMMSKDNLNNIYIIGTTSGFTNRENFVTLKYDQNGILLWQSIYDGAVNGVDIGNYLILDNNANVYVTGSSERAGNGSDFATIKYYSNGNIQWISRFSQNNSSLNNPLKLAIDNFNNIYVTGIARYITTYDDISAIKYSNNGNLLWDYKFNGSFNGNDFPSAILTDQSNNIYITGVTTETNINDIITTFKFSQPIGINPISSQIPNQFSLSQNYPNPFNPSTKIKFQIPASGSVAQTFLYVYDVLGREVAVLVNQQLQPGTYEVDWDASAYPSGVYFYKLSSGVFNDSKKMVLIK